MSTFSKTGSWTERLFVLGHLAKGVVYCLIGLISLAAVIGEAGNPGGMHDVIRWLQNQPFGQLLLVLMVLGLFSYSGWRWIRAIKDLSNDGTSAKGLIKRTAYAVSGTVYGLLAVFTISLINRRGGDGNKQDMLIQILQEPWGQVLIGFVALTIFGVGVYQFLKGYREKFMQEVGKTSMSARERKTFRHLGKAGHLTRSVIYTIMAYFLFRVAIQADASEYRDIGGALDYISQLKMGMPLLAVVGLGLLLYGIFMFVKARYPRLV